MSEQTNAIIAGRKTFFIQPDISLFPENFCEEYLMNGFECYFVENVRKFPLDVYTDYLVETFKDLILFFNIDSPDPGEPWSIFIRKLHKKHEGKLLIGVLYTKRQNREEKALLEKTYLFNIGIPCGCIQLEYQKKTNFGIIEKVLYANQAMGRRKQVRALCNNNSTLSFVFNKNTYTANLQDVSLSHFSFSLPKGQLKMPLYEKVTGIHMAVKGCHIRTNAVLLMSRPIHDDTEDLFVFMFVGYNGQQGLEETTKQTLLPKLYKMMYENCMSLLADVVKEAHLTRI